MESICDPKRQEIRQPWGWWFLNVPLHPKIRFALNRSSRKFLGWWNLPGLGSSARNLSQVHGGRSNQPTAHQTGQIQYPSESCCKQLRDESFGKKNLESSWEWKFLIVESSIGVVTWVLTILFNFIENLSPLSFFVELEICKVSRLHLYDCGGEKMRHGMKDKWVIKFAQKGFRHKQRNFDCFEHLA